MAATSHRPFEPRGERRELVQLIQQIQALTHELQELQRPKQDSPEFDAKGRTLEQLRWRLASVARRTATDHPGAAA